jgi:hypothetical protein
MFEPLIPRGKMGRAGVTQALLTRSSAVRSSGDTQNRPMMDT